MKKILLVILGIGILSGLNSVQAQQLKLKNHYDLETNYDLLDHAKQIKNKSHRAYLALFSEDHTMMSNRLYLFKKDGQRSYVPIIGFSDKLQTLVESEITDLAQALRSPEITGAFWGNAKKKLSVYFRGDTIPVSLYDSLLNYEARLKENGFEQKECESMYQKKFILRGTDSVQVLEVCIRPVQKQVTNKTREKIESLTLKESKGNTLKSFVVSKYANFDQCKNMIDSIGIYSYLHSNGYKYTLTMPNTMEIRDSEGAKLLCLTFLSEEEMQIRSKQKRGGGTMYFCQNGNMYNYQLEPMAKEGFKPDPLPEDIIKFFVKHSRETAVPCPQNKN